MKVSLPWVVEVVLSGLNQEDLKIVVQVGKAAGWDTARAATTTDDDVNLLGDGHFRSLLVNQWTDFS